MHRVTRSAVVLTLLLATASCVESWAVPPQTRPWRVGVGGGFCIGYWGMLGKHGVPRERMREDRLADADYLSRFDVVMIAQPTPGAEPTARAVEEYVRRGGIAITGLHIMPSPAVLPGKRIGTGRGPNMEFVPSPSPVSPGLPAAGILSTTRRPANAIIPEPGRPDTYILARFTDQNAHEDTQGVFRDGDQGAPAIILFKHGEGWWLRSGVWMAFWATLVGPHFEPLFLNTLRHLSDGELVPRWSTASMDPGLLLTRPGDTTPALRKRAGRGEFSPPSEGTHELWDPDPELAGDYDLLGTLPRDESAEVLSAYWNPQWHRAVRFCPEQGVRVVRVEGGVETDVASAEVNLPGDGDLEVHLRRRGAGVYLRVNGVPLLSALDGPDQKGAVATTGLQDVMFQPTGPVEFEDGFMRLPEDESEWHPVSGEWSVMHDKGDRDAGQVQMSANPFRYEAAAPEDGPGMSVVGLWAWDDYHAEASVRPRAEVVGMVGHYVDRDVYIALRAGVVRERGETAAAQLVAVKDGEQHVLASAPATVLWDQWHKVGLRLSGGYIQGLLDGQVVLEALDDGRGSGMAGLLIEGGEALFDDVLIRPWAALPRPYGQPSVADWNLEQGRAEAVTGRAGGIAVTGSPTARLLSSWAGGHAYEVWGNLRPGRAAEAGFLLRYVSNLEHYLLTLGPSPEPRQTVVSLKRRDREGLDTLGLAFIDGPPDRERTLRARLVNGHVQVWVDGEEVLDLVEEGRRGGRVGLYAAGPEPAVFRGLGALPVAQEQHLVDDLMPSFAGIIDRHTWGGRANHLIASPKDMNLFSHRGDFPRDVTIKVGVRQQLGEPAAVASLFLGDGEDPASGYELRATRAWNETQMQVEALRLGQPVAEGTARLPVTRTGFSAELARARDKLILRVDGEAVLSFRDPEPLEARRVGVRLTGALIHPDDTRIESPHVRSYTFGEAATDWTTEVGTWDVASRWSCSPGWTWFSGWDRKDAWTTNKHAFSGDQRMDMYVGAKMVDIEGEDRKQEILRDIRMALCATPGDTSSGYRFTLGGKSNTWTAIERNGEVVAEIRWAVPQGGMHNDWTLVSAVKRGNVVSVEWEGHEILRYEDPEPLASGHPGMGTFDNGLMIPKVTIYGRVVEP